MQREKEDMDIDRALEQLLRTDRESAVGKTDEVDRVDAEIKPDRVRAGLRYMGAPLPVDETPEKYEHVLHVEYTTDKGRRTVDLIMDQVSIGTLAVEMLSLTIQDDHMVEIMELLEQQGYVAGRFE